jgi:hypothetical protein
LHHGRPGARPGDSVALEVDAAAVHLFDPASGTTLEA